MAAVASTALMALEAQLRQEMREAHESLRAEFEAKWALEHAGRLEAERLQQCFRAELEATWSSERMSCQVQVSSCQQHVFGVECQVHALKAEVRDLAGKISDDVPGSYDTLAAGRGSLRLMPEMLHAAGEPAAPDGSCRLCVCDGPSNSRELHFEPGDDPVGNSSAHVLLDSSGTFRHVNLLDADVLKDHEFDFFDLPADMWSVCLMTLTRDLGELMNGGDNCGPHLTRFLYAMGCCAMNLFLQVTILMYVQCYVVGESVWQLQGNYAQFHHDVFDSKGNFQPDKWIEWDGPREDLCGAVISYHILIVVIFLWSARMIGELKTIRRLWDSIRNLAALPAGSSIAHAVVTRNDQTEVHALTGYTRALVYIFVLVPKFAICLWLWMLGLRWLTATVHFGDLILNALALEFVIGIDEQILEFFLPQRTVKCIQETKLAYPSKGKSTESQELKKMQGDYFRNIFYLLLTTACTWAYLRHLQQVLPYFSFDIHDHCGKWYEDRFQPKCSRFEKDCFPFGNVAEAHHYGKRAVDA